MDFTAIAKAVEAATVELLDAAALAKGKILVVGCSTSEVAGEKIGTAGTPDVAAALLGSLRGICQQRGLHLAIQCCEHLNRAIVVERETMQRFQLDEVSVIPVCNAGGALAAQGMADFSDPVVVETIRADAGLDIGGTLIGMHLKPVVVPVRLQHNTVGQARVTGGFSRPKMIGGARAVYDRC